MKNWGGEGGGGGTFHGYMYTSSLNFKFEALMSLKNIKNVYFLIFTWFSEWVFQTKTVSISY